MMTRLDYIDTVGSINAAIEFEEAALAIGAEFMPEYVRAVRDKEKQD